MTIYTMYSIFEDLVDKQSSGAYPEIPIEQKDRFFNLACERFVKQRYGSNNSKGFGFEEIQKRTDDLSNLVRTASLNISTSGVYSTEEYPTVIYNIPTDYWFSITERVRLRTKCRTVTVLAVQGRHDEISYRISDPFNRPKGERVFRVMHSNDTTDNNNNVIELFYDKDVEPQEYLLTYLAQFRRLRSITPYNQAHIAANPTITPIATHNTFGPGNNTGGVGSWFDIEFWFNPETHQEIIDLAVQACLETIEHPRTQSFTQQISNQE